MKHLVKTLNTYLQTSIELWPYADFVEQRKAQI